MTNETKTRERVDLDAITDDQANDILDRIIDRDMDIAEAQIQMVLIASPLAGPIRILRELAEEDDRDFEFVNILS